MAGVQLLIQINVDMCRNREFMCANVVFMFIHFALVKLCHIVDYGLFVWSTHTSKFLIYMEFKLELIIEIVVE